MAIMAFPDLLEEFFASETRRKQGLSPYVEDIYNTLMDRELRRFPKIRNVATNLDDQSVMGVASQFYRYFPAHCIKGYQSLLNLESHFFETECSTQFLNWPESTLVDVGCGTGAVSIAYLTIQMRWQQFLRSRGKTISPIRINILGIDISDSALELYQEFTVRLSRLLLPYLIDVQVSTCHSVFPLNLNQILENHQPIHKHYVLIALSNLVRPLSEMFEHGTTEWSEKIDRALSNETVTPTRFGMAEARVIEAFLNRWQLDQIGILGIATKGWGLYLEALSKEVSERLASSKVTTSPSFAADIHFVNPKRSYWRDKNKRREWHTRFWWQYIHIASRDYTDDEQWEKILDYSNLELAWSRARRYTLSEALADEVEVRLFDIDTELKLIRLRAQLLTYRWDCLNTSQLMQYKAPKSAEAIRPKTVARLEEQIIAAALIQQQGSLMQRSHSFSYQLNGRRNEFLYEYWLHAWKSYIRTTHEYARSRTVLRSDIKDFYKKIDQTKMYSVARDELKLSARSAKILETIIMRNLGADHDYGVGLPQGHIASGFMADMFLAKLDQLIEQEFAHSVTFVRYADDMLFSFDATSGFTESSLRTFTEALGLTLSNSKTVQQDGNDYIEATGLDPHIEWLANERYDPIINHRLFRFDLDHWQSFETRGESFTRRYTFVLRQLGVFFSETWVHRKLSQNRRRAGKLCWPDAHLLFSDVERWLENFRECNRSWLQEVDQVRTEFSSLCEDSYRILKDSDSSEEEQQTAQRRFRFAVNRLCTLELPDHLIDLLVGDLLENPWRLSAKLLCTGLAYKNRDDILGKMVKQSRSAYVRAHSARALGMVEYGEKKEKMSDSMHLLFAILRNGSGTIIEKLKASEALLDLNTGPNLDRETLLDLFYSEPDPYLAKNYLLLLRSIGDNTIDGLVNNIDYKRTHPIIIDAIQATRRRQTREIVGLVEPQLLKEFYSDFYPLMESDMIMIETSSAPDIL